MWYFLLCYVSVSILFNVVDNKATTEAQIWVFWQRRPTSRAKVIVLPLSLSHSDKRSLATAFGWYKKTSQRFRLTCSLVDFFFFISLAEMKLLKKHFRQLTFFSIVSPTEEESWKGKEEEENLEKERERDEGSI